MSDEIDNLKHDIARYIAMNSEYLAENERLRNALEEIEDLAFVRLIDAYSIARHALEAKK